VTERAARARKALEQIQADKAERAKPRARLFDQGCRRYVESGVTATDDRRSEFQRMIDAATIKPSAFDVILVHSFNCLFHDQFQLKFYVRRLAKNGGQPV
jgi:hypothetical protein